MRKTKGIKQQAIRDGRSVGLLCRSEEKSLPVPERLSRRKTEGMHDNCIYSWIKTLRPLKKEKKNTKADWLME